MEPRRTRTETVQPFRGGTRAAHVEPLLIEAMEGNREMEDLDEKLNAISNRIMIMGGVTIDYEFAARLRSAHNRTVTKVATPLNRFTPSDAW